MFVKASKTKGRLRLAICGPAGAGKSFTALRLAHALGDRVAVIDSENGSANLYAGEANPDGGSFDFDVVDLSAMPGRYSAQNYLTGIREARAAGYPVLVIDSLSHAWAGPGGVLDYVDTVKAKSSRGGEGNGYAAWRQGTQAQNELIDAILSYPGHVICTLRSKVEYVQDKDDRGKTVIRKVGLQSVQREGVDYEFTVVGDVDVDSHTLTITKSRCSAIADRQFHKAGADLASALRDWLDKGGEPAVPLEQPVPSTHGNREEPRPKVTVAPREEREARDRDGGWGAIAKSFCSSLPDRYGCTYDELKEFCLQHDMDKPSAMAPKVREKLIGRLDTPDGRKKLDAWLDEWRNPSREPGDESEAPHA